MLKKERKTEQVYVTVESTSILNDDVRLTVMPSENDTIRNGKMSMDIKVDLTGECKRTQILQNLPEST